MWLAVKLNSMPYIGLLHDRCNARKKDAFSIIWCQCPISGFCTYALGGAKTMTFSFLIVSMPYIGLLHVADFNLAVDNGRGQVSMPSIGLLHKRKGEIICRISTKVSMPYIGLLHIWQDFLI